MEPGMSMNEVYQKTWVEGDSFILDFGGHRTGYFKYERGIGEGEKRRRKEMGKREEWRGGREERQSIESRR
jgi:hypothetical protein